MNAIELLKTPFYISNMNMIVPLTTINLHFLNVFKFTGLIISTLMNFTIIFTQTFIFILSELFNMLMKEADTQLVIIIIGAYSVFMFLILDEHRIKLKEQTQQMETIENQLNYLKKMERMRENEEQMIILEFKKYSEETDKKISTMEKKIKKFEKDLKLYE